MVNDDQFVIRSADENILVTSYLSEKGFSEENNGPFVRDDQLYGELEGYFEDSFFDTIPMKVDLESALKDLEEEEIVDQRTHTEAYGEPKFYRLTESGEEAYGEIKGLSELDELDFAYESE